MLVEDEVLKITNATASPLMCQEKLGSASLRRCHRSESSLLALGQAEGNGFRHRSSISSCWLILCGRSFFFYLYLKPVCPVGLSSFVLCTGDPRIMDYLHSGALWVDFTAI